MKTMKRLYAVLMMAAGCAWGQSPAPIPFTADSRNPDGTGLTAYRANLIRYRVTFTDGTNASWRAGYEPYLAWYTNTLATSIATAAVSSVTSAWTNIVDFTFSPSDLNPAFSNGTYRYSVGYKTNGLYTTYRTGVFTLRGDPIAQGVSATTWTTNVNLSLYTFSGFIPYTNISGTPTIASATNYATAAWSNAIAPVLTAAQLSISTNTADARYAAIGANGRVTTVNSMTGGVTIVGGGIVAVTSNAAAGTVTVTGTEADTLATVLARGNTYPNTGDSYPLAPSLLPAQQIVYLSDSSDAPSILLGSSRGALRGSSSGAGSSNRFTWGDSGVAIFGANLDMGNNSITNIATNSLTFANGVSLKSAPTFVYTPTQAVDVIRLGATLTNRLTVTAGSVLNLDGQAISGAGGGGSSSTTNIISFATTNTLPVTGETLTNLTGNPIAVIFSIQLNALNEQAGMVVGTATQCVTSVAVAALDLTDILVGYVNTQQTYSVTAIAGAPVIAWHTRVTISGTTGSGEATNTTAMLNIAGASWATDAEVAAAYQPLDADLTALADGRAVTNYQTTVNLGATGSKFNGYHIGDAGGETNFTEEAFAGTYAFAQATNALSVPNGSVWSNLAWQTEVDPGANFAPASGVYNTPAAGTYRIDWLVSWVSPDAIKAFWCGIGAPASAPTRFALIVSPSGADRTFMTGWDEIVATNGQPLALNVKHSSSTAEVINDISSSGGWVKFKRMR